MRIGFNLCGGDAPQLFIEVKDGVRHFFTFKKFEFFEPTSDKAQAYSFSSSKFYKDDCDEDSDDNDDRDIRPWSWWILLDDNVEISCIFRGAHSADAIFSIYDGYDGSQTDIDLTDNEANTLYTQMKKEILALPNVNAGAKGILRPAAYGVEFPVKSCILEKPDAIITRPARYKTHFTFLEQLPSKSESLYMYIQLFAILISIIIGRYSYSLWS